MPRTVVGIPSHTHLAAAVAVGSGDIGNGWGCASAASAGPVAKGAEPAGVGSSDPIAVVSCVISADLGSGIVIDGELYEGAGFVAGEFGHISIVPEGRKCACGRKGCLEVYASGNAIAKYAREKMKSHSSKIKKLTGVQQPFSAKIVGIAAKAGDRLAIESYKQAAYYLGIGIANLMNVLNPETIVIGGGVLRSAPPVYWSPAGRLPRPVPGPIPLADPACS